MEPRCQNSRYDSFSIFLALLICFGATHIAAQDNYLYGIHPGKSTVTVRNDFINLSNDVLTARWSTTHGKLRGVSTPGSPSLVVIPVSENAFSVVFGDGRILTSATMTITDGPRVEELLAEPDAASMEEHFAGKRVVLSLEDSVSKLAVLWSAILRDGDNYFRQQITLSSSKNEFIREVRLVDSRLPGAHVEGSVKGSPVIAGQLFLGFEHPLSRCSVEKEQVRCSIDRELPLKAGQSVTYSSVMGIAPVGQMRRAFLNYVERERAHPYRPFLHYNSWYDIGYGNSYDEAAALNVINTFGEELTRKRKVKLDSFLFDDGWDDPQTLWGFHAGFPNGFSPLKTAAAKYGAAPGVWFSPWGGYEEAKAKRLTYGTQQGFETNEGGFALSGPKYYARFREVTLDFIRKYGINQFKVDGTGNVNSVFGESEFDSDFHAAISLIREWRSLKPDIFINLTTGTYPSPFWLQYADSIWRGGEDHSFVGVGPWRERWITYRDADTYKGIVQRGSLFPLNSVMLHGIIFARHAEHLRDDPEKAFVNEVHSYFGSGTQLQELYITPALLSNENWEDLAEAANWSRRNAAILADTHWVGGNPGKLEVYGWAAWSPERGILTLRNPSDHPQSFSLDVARAFELPRGAPLSFVAHSPWRQNKQEEPTKLTSGEPHSFDLAPFQVLNLETIPAP